MPNALTLESMSPGLLKVGETRSPEPHRRKSRMREIRSYGSGEEPGRVTSRPTLQRHFCAGAPEARLLEAPELHPLAATPCPRLLRRASRGAATPAGVPQRKAERGTTRPGHAPQDGAGGGPPGAEWLGESSAGQIANGILTAQRRHVLQKPPPLRARRL
jgi:hypothetical protein